MNNVSLQPNVLPFPYFLVDRKLDIKLIADSTHLYFPDVVNFLELVDEGSKRKAVKFIIETPSINKIELNMQTLNSKFSIYDVYVHYESLNSIHLFCIDKSSQVEHIKSLVSELEYKLMNVTYSLLEEKATLEQTIEQIQQSALEHNNLATVGKLAASIAHEIRNPLTSVRGFVQLLRPHLIEIGKEHYADIAISELDRANDIIYEFLNTSKPSKPTLEQVSIVSVIEEVMLLCQSESILNDCTFDYIRPSVDVLIYIDVKQMKQVLLNLIKNAMEAIKESSNEEVGIIKIDIRHIHNNVEISIADNGSGIDEEKLKQIFTPFFTTKKKGTGVGLAVCKRIIEEHYGKIDVVSKVEQGTTFKLILPIEQKGKQLSDVYHTLDV